MPPSSPFRNENRNFIQNPGIHEQGNLSKQKINYYHWERWIAINIIEIRY